jgi:hypothetical protein
LSKSKRWHQPHNMGTQPRYKSGIEVVGTKPNQHRPLDNLRLGSLGRVAVSFPPSLPQVHPKLSPLSSRFTEPALRCRSLSLTTVFGLTDDIMSPSRIVAVTMAPIKVGFSCSGHSENPYRPALSRKQLLANPWLEGLKSIVWVLRKRRKRCSQLLTFDDHRLLARWQQTIRLP